MVSHGDDVGEVSRALKARWVSSGSPSSGSSGEVELTSHMSSLGRRRCVSRAVSLLNCCLQRLHWCWIGFRLWWVRM